MLSVYVDSALINLYVELSFVEDSMKVLDEMSVRYIAGVNVVLLGYCESRCLGK